VVRTGEGFPREGDHALGGQPRQGAGGVDRGRYSDTPEPRPCVGAPRLQRLDVCTRRALLPCVTSKDLLALFQRFEARSLDRAVWTNRSFPPSSGVMNPSLES